MRRSAGRLVARRATSGIPRPPVTASERMRPQLDPVAAAHQVATGTGTARPVRCTPSPHRRRVARHPPSTPGTARISDDRARRLPGARPLDSGHLGPRVGAHGWFTIRFVLPLQPDLGRRLADGSSSELISGGAAVSPKIVNSGGIAWGTAYFEPITVASTTFPAAARAHCQAGPACKANSMPNASWPGSTGVYPRCTGLSPVGEPHTDPPGGPHWMPGGQTASAAAQPQIAVLKRFAEPYRPVTW